MEWFYTKTSSNLKNESNPTTKSMAAMISPIASKPIVFQYSSPKTKAIKAPIPAPLPGSGTATKVIMMMLP